MRVQITVPPNTPKTAPYIVTLQYGAQVMRVQSIKFPDAKCYLRGLQMYAGHRSARIIPEADSNVEWLVDNARTIIKNIMLDFDAPTFEVVFKCYNQDDSYEHSFYIDLD